LLNSFKSSTTLTFRQTIQRQWQKYSWPHHQLQFNRKIATQNTLQLPALYIMWLSGSVFVYLFSESELSKFFACTYCTIHSKILNYQYEFLAGVFIPHSHAKNCQYDRLRSFRSVATRKNWHLYYNLRVSKMCKQQ
jgi:hypothetical protein